MIRFYTAAYLQPTLHKQKSAPQMFQLSKEWTTDHKTDVIYCAKNGGVEVVITGFISISVLSFSNFRTSLVFQFVVTFTIA
jgi:hypothetical protein